MSLPGGYTPYTAGFPGILPPGGYTTDNSADEGAPSNPAKEPKSKGKETQYQAVQNRLNTMDTTLAALTEAINRLSAQQQTKHSAEDKTQLPTQGNASQSFRDRPETSTPNPGSGPTPGF
jgi:hypothetical protein